MNTYGHWPSFLHRYRQHFRCCLVLCLYLLCSTPLTHAQTRQIRQIDSLFRHAPDLASKQKNFLQLYDHINSMSVEKLGNYLQEGKPLFVKGTVLYDHYESGYCPYFYKSGKIRECIQTADQILGRAKAGDLIKRPYLNTLLYKCVGYIRNNESKEAIENIFLLLQRSEQAKDSQQVVKGYSILGWAYMELDKYDDAIRWMQKGIQYTQNPSILAKSSNIFTNIASCYNNINQMDSAHYYIEKGIFYSTESENLAILANAYNIRADMYIKEGRMDLAEKDMQQALQVREQNADRLYVISDLGQLAFFYASNHQPEKGIATAQKGIVLARELKNLPKLIYLYQSLANNYQVADSLEAYAACLSTIIQLKDSLYAQNAGDALAELETKYELQKKENIIMRQQYELSRNRFITFGLGALSLLGLLSGWLVYRNYRLTQKRKLERAMLEQKLMSFKAVEQAKESERKRIAADLHDNLGAYAAAISANVRNMQESETARQPEIIQQLDENAQHMVTQLGDTIWVLKNEHLPITKLADRFKLWTQRLIQNYPGVKYHYEEFIQNDIEFTPNKILQIFLVLKECVNNALKHSQCTDLKISFQSDSHWTIRIEDNGIGFNPDQRKKGSGISNIQKRVMESGWSVRWEAVAPQGTRITISETTIN